MGKEKKSIEERLKYFPELKDLFEQIISYYEDSLQGEDPAASAEERMQRHLESKKQFGEDYIDSGAMEQALGSLDLWGLLKGMMGPNIDPAMLEELMGSVDLEGIEGGEESLQEMMKQMLEEDPDKKEIDKEGEKK